MSDITKWYMRLLLFLAVSFFYTHLIINYFTFFFKPEGMFFGFYENLYGVFQNSTFQSEIGIIFLCVLLLVFMVGTLFWPRFFVWPAAFVNAFILVMSLELIWRNYVAALSFWAQSQTVFGRYTWVLEQVFFVSGAALFILFLTPSMVHLMAKMRWYKGLGRIWNRIF